MILIFASTNTAPIGFLIILFLLGQVFLSAKKYNKSIYKTLVSVSKWKVFFDKGLFGEYLTVRALEGLTPNEKFLVNVYLDKARKKDETTEVDVIYTNEYGIFVLESKNFSGWIFGNEKARYWTQSLNKRTKNKFYNPIFQNAGHISALKNFLGNQYDNAYRSLIVFSERCELKKVSVHSENVYIVKRNHIRHTVKELSNHAILTAEQINDIHEKLTNRTMVTDDVKESHVQNIMLRKATPIPKKVDVVAEVEAVIARKANQDVATSTEQKICDRCGADMILRIAKRGQNQGQQFWGCSNYPKCKNTLY